MTTDVADQAAPPLNGFESPFNASRPQACKAAVTCDGSIAPGDRAFYLGLVPTGHLVACSACRDALTGQVAEASTAPTPDAASASAHPAAPAEQAAAGGWEMTAPEALVLPPADQAIAADLQPWDGSLCACSNRQTGFRRDSTSNRWVHNECGRPALRYEDGRASAATPITEPGEVVDQAAVEAEAEATEELEGDDQGTPKTCDCGRVSKKAKVVRDAAGRAIHEHCGGQLREKHMHLAPPPAEPQETTDQEQTEEHDDDDQSAAGEPDPGVDAPAGPVEAAVSPGDGAEGQPAGDAAGAVRPGEDREGPGGAGAQDDHGRDQARGADGGPGDDGLRPAQRVPDGAAAGARGDVDAGRLGPVQGGAPTALREPDEAVDGVEGRAAEVAAGGLAAFWMQPVDDEPAAPEHTLAEFWSQPADATDLELAHLLLEKLGRQYGGTVLGIVVLGADGQTRQHRIAS